MAAKDRIIKLQDEKIEGLKYQLSELLIAAQKNKHRFAVILGERKG
jgi:hypothetical protein